MKEGFEKKFTDIQTGLISLCLEAAEGRADAVYAYAYVGEGSSMFNAFFEREGAIVPAHKLIADKDLLFQLMKYGTDDLEKLRMLCREYEAVCPMEMKMRYDCRTKKFIADCRYRKEDGVEASPQDSFLSWRNEIASARG